MRLLKSVFGLVMLATILVVVLGLWQRTSGNGLSAALLALARIHNPPAPHIIAETRAAEYVPFTPAQIAELQPTFTPLPTPLPTATPLPTPTPVPPFQTALPAVTLTGLRHEWQTWNNCGPATLAMDMSYFGSTIDQAQAGAVLRLSPDDKNVSPDELVAYARNQGYQSMLLINGSQALARTLLSNNIPVLVETWHEAEPNNGMGHYRLLTGYDDATQQWTVFDSYDDSNLISADPYLGSRFDYGTLDQLWKVFNRTFVLVYPPAQEPAVAAILAAFQVQPETMAASAAARAQTELDANPNDAFAWFNLGSSLTAQGQYHQAAAAFDQARTIGLPWRMLWYQFGPFEAYLAMGRAQDVITLADQVNAGTDSIEEIHYWRARGLAALGDSANARVALQQSLTLNPTFAPAQSALAQLN